MVWKHMVVCKVMIWDGKGYTECCINTTATRVVDSRASRWVFDGSLETDQISEGA